MSHYPGRAYHESTEATHPAPDRSEAEGETWPGNELADEVSRLAAARTPSRGDALSLLGFYEAEGAWDPSLSRHDTDS